MNIDTQELHSILHTLADSLDSNDEPNSKLYSLFFQHPDVAFDIIDILNSIDAEESDDDSLLYSACIFALDICVAQLQAATEANNKLTAKLLDKLMSHIAAYINEQKHPLNYWLPILNAFYEAHIELSEELKDSYYNLANQEEIPFDEMDINAHLNSIRDLIHELSDLSVFEIAENFFAQSYAMPPEFFSDLVLDLCSIEEGIDIAFLTLLHPKAEVREIAVATINEIIDQITISSASLTRIKTIKQWYPKDYEPSFDHWMKVQRKKGVLFEPDPNPVPISIKATEIDGSGSQGIFIHIHKNRKNRMCGMLLKYGVGIKDTWITPVIPAKEAREYYKQAYQENISIREVDIDYFRLLSEHFLAITLEQMTIPSMHLLEIMELIGIKLHPQKIDIDYLFEHLSIQIQPFTQETLKISFERSKMWLRNKRFTESWYIENPLIDKIVNHNCSFIDGVKVCKLNEAINEVFAEEMEANRNKWEFHFLWTALWAKAKEKASEKIWQDSFLIAHSIHDGTVLKDIPVMQEICRQTVINSVETMQERRTHLSKE